MRNAYLESDDIACNEALEELADKVLIVKFEESEVNHFRKKGRGFIVNIEDYDDVSLGNISALRGRLKKAMRSVLLSSEKQTELLAILKKRFEAKDKMYYGTDEIIWANLQKKLEANPEKLWSLNEMERTGGEPNVIKYNRYSDEYVFFDCSPETPSGRVNCVYDRIGEEILKREYTGEMCSGNAINLAAMMGVSVLSEIEYRELQLYGKFDQNSWSWIRPMSYDKVPAFEALIADLHGDGYVNVRRASSHINNYCGGFRACLRV